MDGKEEIQKNIFKKSGKVDIVWKRWNGGKYEN